MKRACYSVIAVITMMVAVFALRVTGVGADEDSCLHKRVTLGHDYPSEQTVRDSYFAANGSRSGVVTMVTDRNGNTKISFKDGDKVTLTFECSPQSPPTSAANPPRSQKSKPNKNPGTRYYCKFTARTAKKAKDTVPMQSQVLSGCNATRTNKGVSSVVDGTLINYTFVDVREVSGSVQWWRETCAFISDSGLKAQVFDCQKGVYSTDGSAQAMVLPPPDPGTRVSDDDLRRQQEARVATLERARVNHATYHLQWAMLYYFGESRMASGKEFLTPSPQDVESYLGLLGERFRQVAERDPSVVSNEAALNTMSMEVAKQYVVDRYGREVWNSGRPPTDRKMRMMFCLVWREKTVRLCREEYGEQDD